MDFELENGGSVLVLRPVTPAALEWVEEHIGEDNGYQPYWPAVVIEARYAGAVLEGIISDGLTV